MCDPTTSRRLLRPASDQDRGIGTKRSEVPGASRCAFRRRTRAARPATSGATPSGLPRQLESRLHKLPGLNAHGTGETLNVQQTDVTFASLDRADIRAMQSRFVGQGFLR